jgi:hypothetical protein
VAKTVAKISKLKLKVQNICTQLRLNVKTGTTNHVLKLVFLAENVKKWSSKKLAISKISPNLCHSGNN